MLPQIDGKIHTMDNVSANLGSKSTKRVKPFILFSPVFFILLFFSTPISCTEKKPSFPETYEQEAVATSELPAVVPTHPRLLLRSTPWDHGPDLETLHKWSKKGSFAHFISRKPWNPKPQTEWAFRYLITGNEKYVDPIVQKMKEKESYWPGKLYNIALQYDWLYNSPNFSKTDKEILENRIINWAKRAIDYGQDYHDMWSHFGYRPVLDIAAAGLALYGHRPEAADYLAMTKGYMKNTLFPGWRANGGAWQGGWDYYGQGAKNLFNLIAIWSSATKEDLYEIIEKEGGDWVRGHMHFLISTMHPDHSPMESWGFGSTPDQKGGTKTLLLLARAYQDEEAAAHLQWRDEWGWRLGISQYLYYYPLLSKKIAKPKRSPLTQIWGKEGVGYIQMRSGWEPEDTIIEFKSGDYFWSHSSFNQNAFTIYHKGRLAIRSGIYSGGYWGEHVLKYYRPTVGSNSILVIDPDEKTWVPPGQASKLGVSTTNGYINDFGGQRSCYIHPDLGSAETCFTFKKYLYRKNNQHHFETGVIDAYEVKDRYSYVLGDATNAYNNPVFAYPGNKAKLDLFTRQLVFLDKKYLLVFDRVRSLDPSYEKRWLLHSVGEPQIAGNPVHLETPYHLETFPAGTAVIENGEGRLVCRTLFPENYNARKVGGGAQISTIKADINNTGDASLNGQIVGSMSRVSPTIATEQAIKEEWVVEFTDGKTFTIQGSKTGNDGTGQISGKKRGIFFSNSGRIFIPHSNWKGTPKRGDKFYFSVLSKSHRFWVDGTNYLPASAKGLAKQFQEGSPVDPGNWRIEVTPKKQQKYDTFFHFLYPCDRDASGVAPDTQEVSSSDEKLRGVSIKDWVVLFQATEQFSGRTSYKVNSDRQAEHLILGLQPSHPYRIAVSGHSLQSTDDVIKASENGTIRFTSNGPCEVVVDAGNL